MEPEPVKPGYLTTEFWLTLVVQVVAVGVLFGFIAKGEQQVVQDTLAAAVKHAAALAAIAISVWKFIQSRAEVKSAHSKAVVAVAEEKASENRLTVAERRKHS